MQYRVIDRFTQKELSAPAILQEVNRDRSDTWQPYTPDDLETAPADVLEWLDFIHYQIERV